MMGRRRVTRECEMPEILLSVQNLKKYFPVYSGVFRHQVGEIKAVDGISFDIGAGEVLGMVGESGSGKSTAGRSAIRLIEPTDGEVNFMGENLLAFKSHAMKQVRTKIQIVFQDPYASLNPRKTILESIGEALLYHEIVKTKDDQVDQVAALLKQVGLSPDVMKRYPHEFSGGQQQRICIGRALAMQPKLIVCDEAVSALDVSVQAQILNLLAELKETLNLSYLFITHDLSVVRYLCDRVVVMHMGKIVESTDVTTLFENPQDPYTKKLLSAIPKDKPD